MSAAQRLAAQRALAAARPSRPTPPSSTASGTSCRRTSATSSAGSRPTPAASASPPPASSPRSCATGRCGTHAEHYPPWSFDTNKGYPCPVHKAALQAYGPSVIHRRTWVFMDHYVPWPGISRDLPPRAADPVLTIRVEYVGAGRPGTTYSDRTHVRRLVSVVEEREDLGGAGEAVAGGGRAGADADRAAVVADRLEHLLVGAVVADEHDGRAPRTSSRSSATASRLARRPGQQLDDAVARQHVGAGDVLGLLAAARSAEPRARARDGASRTWSTTLAGLTSTHAPSPARSAASAASATRRSQPLAARGRRARPVRSSRRSIPCSPKISTWSGNPNRPRSSTVRPDTTATGVRRRPARRRPRASPGSSSASSAWATIGASTPSTSRPTSSGRASAAAIAATAAGSSSRVTSGRSSRQVAAAVRSARKRSAHACTSLLPHDLAQPGHPRPALVAVHLDGGDDRLAQRLARRAG